MFALNGFKAHHSARKSVQTDHMRQELNQHVKWVFDGFFSDLWAAVVLAGVADVSLKISIFTKGYLSE